MHGVLSPERVVELRAIMAEPASSEPKWPACWTTTCPCGVRLQGGTAGFHAHWLVVHHNQG